VVLTYYLNKHKRNVDYTTLVFCIIITCSLLLSSNSIAKPSNTIYQQLDSLRINVSNNPQTALKEAFYLMEIAHKNENDSAIAEANNTIAHILDFQGLSSLALEHYIAALIFFNSSYTQTLNIAWLNFQIGNIFFDKGLLEEAMAYYNTSRQIFISLGKLTSEATAVNNMALIAIENTNYNLAMEYFMYALKLRKKDGKVPFNLIHQYYYIGNLYYTMGDFTSAMKYYQKIIDAPKLDNNDNLNLAGLVYQYLGEIYLRQSKTGKAMHEFELARQNYMLNNRSDLLCKINLRLGELALKNNRNSRAIAFLEDAYEISNNNNLYKLRFEAITKIIEYYKHRGDLKMVIKFDSIHNCDIKEYYKMELNQTLLSMKLKIKLSKLQLDLSKKDYENEVHLKKLAMNEADIYELKTRQYIYLSAFIVIAFIVLIVFMLIANKNKKALLEKIILEKNKEKLEIELKSKEKELTVNAMQLVQINEITLSIFKRLKLIWNNVTPKNKIQLGRIITDLKTLHQTSMWEEFEARFVNVHKDFFDTLHKINPNLTPTEIKICSFIRLNMTSKDIAILTNRSLRTIEGNRTSIRKKLNLNISDSLTKYMLSI